VGVVEGDYHHRRHHRRHNLRPMLQAKLPGS